MIDMPYVERDGNGDITGIFAIEQPGIAEEFIGNNDPDVVAFRNPLPPTPRQQIVARLRADPILKAQVIDSFVARGITDKSLMLDALEARFADVI